MLDKAVVDLSHWDEVDSFEDAKDDGVVGIIHKATESNNTSIRLITSAKRMHLLLACSGAHIISCGQAT
jgi:GH25 family lysozyme M1 (1,4-beta-N-acetylmuramidase)